MYHVLECPKCKREVKLDEWVDTECPTCGLSGYWDSSFLDDDTNEEWVFFCWNYNK